mgnify:FL=1
MSTETFDRINQLFSDLLDEFPRGVSSTSTAKYNGLVAYFAEALGLSETDIYATGAATRASNLDTRLAQGNQRAAHTKLGLSFLKFPIDVSDFDNELEKRTQSVLNTCTKFVEGREGTSYENIIVLVQPNDHTRLIATRILSLEGNDLIDSLSELLPGVSFELIEPYTEVADEQQKGSSAAIKGHQKTRDMATVHDLLSKYKNVIVYGPPGTGKTREASLLMNEWRRANGSQSVSTLTFHPTYCYEDFIEGFRPNPKTGHFELTDGFFKEFCEVASKDRDNDYLLVVDEINRGDVAKIFGEMITAIEKDKRDDSYVVTLQQSKKPFSVPSNVFLLGTMNSSDKSISLMDLAIRRRFAFYNLRTDYSVFSKTEFVDQVEEIDLGTLLKTFNDNLVEQGIDSEKTLGQSYLLIRKDEYSGVSSLRDKLTYEIIPILEEYFFADRSLIKNILGSIVDDKGCPVDAFFDDDQLVKSIKSLIG